jgi:cytochrome b561
MTDIKNNLTQTYSKATILIHWVTALMILFLFPLGKYMEGLEPSEKMGLIQIHAIVGLVIFLLTLVRTYLFFKAPRPDDLKTGSALNDKLVTWIHNSFYVLLFLVSISGIGVMIAGGYGEALQANNPGLIKSPEKIPPLDGHGFFSLIIMVLFLMHVGGVVKHYVVTKENTLERMM